MEFGTRKTGWKIKGRNHEMKVNLPSWVVFAASIGFSVSFTSGTQNCESFGDCVLFSGYTCKNNKCVCDPDDPGLFRCIAPKIYGERCTSDQECQLADYNLHCLKSDVRICKCKRGYLWERQEKRCISRLDDDRFAKKFDPVGDFVIPVLVIMTLSAMLYLGFKVFCNCGKLWRRRRHQEIARELQDISAAPHQQAWIASYRVYSPYGNSNRSSSALPPTSFPLHPTPCMGLFVASQPLSQSPPPYEEALKHKVILSSYPNPSPPVVPVPVATYTLPPADIPRQYQTLPPNASASSSIILNPNIPNASAIKVPTMAHRSYSLGPEPYSTSLTGEWTQIQHTGTIGPMRQPESSHETVVQPEVEAVEQHSRLHPLDVWTPVPRNPGPQPRSGLYRPGQPQKIYHGSDSPRTTLNNDQNS